MSCLPFVKHLRSFGRIIKSMALKIRNLKLAKTHSYKLPFIDSESENNSGSYESPVPPRYLTSPAISEPPTLKTDYFDQKRLHEVKMNEHEEPKYNFMFRSISLDDTPAASLPSLFDASLSSSLFSKSNWDESINNLFDPNTKQFAIFENFLQSSSHGGFSDCSMFSYSPLSSVDSLTYNSHNDLYRNEMNFRMQQECIRKEFEMNGFSVDDPGDDFQPTAMSTPFVERKSDQFNINSRNDSPSQENKENFFDRPQNEKTTPDFLTYPSILIQIHNERRNQQPKIEENKPKWFNQNSVYHSKKTAAKKKVKGNGKKKQEDYCVFCKNNGVDEKIYKSHSVKDSKGRVLCPKLRSYQCPICGEDGDNSHTLKYCPQKPIVTMEDLEKLSYASKRF